MTGSLECAHARMSARHGARPDALAWRRIEALRELGPMLEAARATALRRWLAGIGPSTPPHAIGPLAARHGRALRRRAALVRPRPVDEGQIVLSRDLDRRGVYPPVDVLPSLSRLMKDGIGARYTLPDHPALSAQLCAAYARAAQARVLASVVGEDGLGEADRRYLALDAAVARHGLDGVQAHPCADAGDAALRRAPRGEMGVRLQDAAPEPSGPLWADLVSARSQHVVAY